MFCTFKEKIHVSSVRCGGIMLRNFCTDYPSVRTIFGTY